MRRKNINKQLGKPNLGLQKLRKQSQYDYLDTKYLGCKYLT